MRATLWAHFSLGIAKFDTLPTPFYTLVNCLFATHGLLVHDNGPPFSSAEFHYIIPNNGITHHRVPLYHLSPNWYA